MILSCCILSIFCVSFLLVPRVLPEFSKDIRAFCTTCYDDHNSTREMLSGKFQQLVALIRNCNFEKIYFDEVFIMIDRSIDRVAQIARLMRTRASLQIMCHVTLNPFEYHSAFAATFALSFTDSLLLYYVHAMAMEGAGDIRMINRALHTGIVTATLRQAHA